MQDQPIDRKEGYELLRGAAKDVLNVSDEEWPAKQYEVTRKLWEQVRSRLEEAIPEEHILDVMDALLQAEMRINADGPGFAPWSNRMLVERLGEDRLRMLLEAHGGRWRLVGKVPRRKILPAALADLYERAEQLEEQFGLDSPECQQATRELTAWLNRQLLEHAFSNMARQAMSLEAQARQAFLQPDLVQVEVSVGDPADLPEALGMAFSIAGPARGNSDLPEHIGSILQRFVGMGIPGAPSGSLVIDMANGLVNKDQLREIGRQRRAGMEAYLAEHPEEQPAPPTPPDTLVPPPSGEDAYHEGDDNQGAQPGGTVDTEETGIDHGAP